VPGFTVGYEGGQAEGFRPAVNRITWTGDAGVSASLDDMIAWERHIDATRDNPESIYQRLAAPVAFTDGANSGYGFGLARGEILGRQIRCNHQRLHQGAGLCGQQNGAGDRGRTGAGRCGGQPARRYALGTLAGLFHFKAARELGGLGSPQNQAGSQILVSRFGVGRWIGGCSLHRRRGRHQCAQAIQTKKMTLS
jgi:hypothetical protein